MTGLMKKYPQYLGIGIDEGDRDRRHRQHRGSDGPDQGRVLRLFASRRPATRTTPRSRPARSTTFRHAKESRSERAQVLAAPLMAGSDFEQPVTLRTRTNSTRAHSKRRMRTTPPAWRKRGYRRSGMPSSGSDFASIPRRLPRLPTLPGIVRRPEVLAALAVLAVLAALPHFFRDPSY